MCYPIEWISMIQIFLKKNLPNRLLVTLLQEVRDALNFIDLFAIKRIKKYQAWYFSVLLLSVCSISFAAENVEVKSSSIEPSQYIGQIILSLVFILLIIFASAWLLKRFGKVNGVAGEHMKVLGVMSLGQRERVVLMQVGEEQLLIGVTASRISLLHQLDEPLQMSDSRSVSSAFANKLQEAMSSKK